MLDRSIFFENANTNCANVFIRAIRVRAIASKSKFWLFFQIRRGLKPWLSTGSRFDKLNAPPSGLRITSPKDFRVLRSGFSRAESGDRCDLSF
jgi:hypothetical protein